MSDQKFLSTDISGWCKVEHLIFSWNRSDQRLLLSLFQRGKNCKGLSVCIDLDGEGCDQEVKPFRLFSYKYFGWYSLVNKWFYRLNKRFIANEVHLIFRFSKHYQVIVFSNEHTKLYKNLVWLKHSEVAFKICLFLTDSYREGAYSKKCVSKNKKY